MTRLGRDLVITIVAAAVAGGAGAWFGARYVVDRSEEPSLHAFVHHDLALTPEQDRRIEAIERRFAARRTELEGEVRAANAALGAAIQTQHVYSSQVGAAIERIHDAMGRLQIETVRHVLEMRVVMTPEQAQEFDQRVGEALTDQAT